MGSARGFGLVEALVALVVLSIGALGVLSVQGVSLGFSREAQIRSQASVMAEFALEMARANREAAIAGEYDIGFDERVEATCGAQQSSPAEDLACWQAMLTDNLPAGRGRIEVRSLGADSTFTNASFTTPVDPYRVTVTVLWGRGGGEDQARRVQLVSEL
jgi:type IV pilus assembly protein PilV